MENGTEGTKAVVVPVNNRGQSGRRDSHFIYIMIKDVCVMARLSRRKMPKRFWVVRPPSQQGRREKRK